MLAHRLFIAQVMMMLHETVEQWLVAGSPYLLQLDGLQRPESFGDRRSIEQHRRRTLPLDEGIQ